MKYVILDADEVDEIVFSEILEDSASTLHYNLAETQAIVKYNGAKPRFLYGKDTHNHAEMLTILNGSAWCDPSAPPNDED